MARDLPGPWSRRLRRLIGKRLLPTRIEVREGEEDSLLLLIDKAAGLWRDHVTVRDAEEQVLGQLATDMAAGGMRILDRYENFLAEVRRDGASGGFQFVASGQVVLGQVAQEPAGGHRLVIVDEILAGDPFAKMLFLSMVLAIDFL